METTAFETPINTPPQPKRPYTKKQKQSPTIACYDEQIEVKIHQIKAIGEDIEILRAKRNNLFFQQSEGMGLIALLGDPKKAKWLEDMIEKSNKIQNEGSAISEIEENK